MDAAVPSQRPEERIKAIEPKKIATPGPLGGDGTTGPVTRGPKRWALRVQPGQWSGLLNRQLLHREPQGRGQVQSRLVVVTSIPGPEALGSFVRMS